MPTGQLKCPKCHASMEEGFIVDYTHHHSRVVPEWVEGAPDERWWGLKTGDKEKLKVETFRCVRCGYLESYAPDPQE